MLIYELPLNTLVFIIIEERERETPPIIDQMLDACIIQRLLEKVLRVTIHILADWLARRAHSCSSDPD